MNVLSKTATTIKSWQKSFAELEFGIFFLGLEHLFNYIIVTPGGHEDEWTSVRELGCSCFPADRNAS